MIEAAAFVNWRRVEVGDPPILALVLTIDDGILIMASQVFCGSRNFQSGRELPQSKTLRSGILHNSHDMKQRLVSRLVTAFADTACLDSFHWHASCLNPNVSMSA